ncbi:MAG: hypothetical protein A4E49_01610 [Methanosaeta sp. PtaU1.Bin112]|nr:MAG: hypothetical protein A4E49_01610 [Methanosaeta sp. PtaU1.Bin112]
MKNGPLAVLLIVIFALDSLAGAVHWASSVDTNSTHWSIFRQSSNLSFDLSSSINGSISAIDISPAKSRSRILQPYQSYYAEVGNNDVHFRQRTSSLEGSYRSSDQIMMQSAVYPDEINITVTKPSGTDLFTIEYGTERWPVFIKSKRTLAYSGKGINDRDFEGNNGDFAGASFLYNRELSKEQKTIMWLQRMNATVQAADDSTIFAELKPTKYLGYEINSSSTGVADLSYRFRDTHYDAKHQNYPALSMSEERYYGAYDLMRKINMKTVFERANNTDDQIEGWLPCCFEGWKEMTPSEKLSFSEDAKEVFDCTCYKEIRTQN